MVFVNGGGQGIGRAFCHALSEAGAFVAVVDLVPESAEALAHELSQKGIDSLAVTADVTDDAQIQKMMDIYSVVNHWVS